MDNNNSCLCAFTSSLLFFSSSINREYKVVSKTAAGISLTLGGLN